MSSSWKLTLLNQKRAIPMTENELHQKEEDAMNMWQIYNYLDELIDLTDRVKHTNIDGDWNSIIKNLGIIRHQVYEISVPLTREIEILR